MQKAKDSSKKLKSSPAKNKLVEPNNMVEKFKNLTVKNKNFRDDVELPKSKKQKEASLKDKYLWSTEDIPKLRRPKEETLQRIRAEQTNTENTKDVVDLTKQSKTIDDVPLRQEFLTKKLEIEKATDDLLQSYANHKIQKKMLLGDDYGLSTEDAQSLTLDKNIVDFSDTEFNYYINGNDNLNSELLNSKPNNSSYTTTNKKIKNIFDILTYPEHLIYKIIYAKVNGHPNGCFAEEIPDWYRKTFDKDLESNWLEICRKSQEFLIENVQGKIVLYIKSKDGEEYISDNDINACGDLTKDTQPIARANENFGEQSSVGSVSYKRLQKSLQNCDNNAGRKKLNKASNEAVKQPNKFTKNNKKTLKK